MNTSVVEFLEWAEGAVERGLCTQKEADDRAVLLATLDNVERALDPTLYGSLERQLLDDEAIQRRLRANGKDPSDYTLTQRLRMAISPAEYEAWPNGAEPEFNRPVSMSAEEFVALERPETKPLIGEPRRALMARYGLGFMVGRGGHGKTSLALDLVLHLAIGDRVVGVRGSAAALDFAD